MREAAFIKINNKKWKEFQEILEGRKKTSPDILASLFIQVTDDLSFSRTHYPESQTTAYLNSLALKTHLAIYKNKKEKKGRFKKFWLYELPLLFKGVHKQLLYAFLLFSLSFILGAVSAAYDDTFVRLILGEQYVNMTLENIEKGDPLAVYKSEGSGSMFLAITTNNIKVSFFAFIYGILLSFGTAYIIFSNGIMVGAFQYFFYQKGFLITSLLTIWIHGALEIPAIIIAGAAGFVMGNSILFPGTYSRMESFRSGAKKGLKIVIGLIPIFIAAGFLESFVTRQSDLHWSIKLSIILFSLYFIIYYFIIYPIKLNKYGNDYIN